MPVDPDKRKEIYHAALKIVNDKVLGVWLFTRAEIDAFRSNVDGWEPNGWDGITWKTENWTVRR